MTLTIAIPDRIENRLRAEWGSDLPRRALEVVAVEGYRSGALSVGQVAETLGISVYEADGVLKKHRVDLRLTIDEPGPHQAASAHQSVRPAKLQSFLEAMAAGSEKSPVLPPEANERVFYYEGQE